MDWIAHKCSTMGVDKSAIVAVLAGSAAAGACALWADCGGGGGGEGLGACLLYLSPRHPKLARPIDTDTRAPDNTTKCTAYD